MLTKAPQVAAFTCVNKAESVERTLSIHVYDASRHHNVFHRFLGKQPLPVLGFWVRMWAKLVSIDQVLHAGHESGTFGSLALPVRAKNTGKYRKHLKSAVIGYIRELNQRSSLYMT